jgi:uncharacterized membrane protein
MEGHLIDWLSLLTRWAHFTVGVAWIGASFYFNWLENHLQRAGRQEGIAGDLWAVHGGGFYYLQKFAVAPANLPPRLHWFKWEAYATWLTGFALLCLVFYWPAQSFMVDPRVAELPAGLAVATGIGSLALSWLVYDGLCRSPLAHRERLLGILVFGWFALLAFALSQLLSGRAAFVHAGAAAGTVMVANVYRVIIPAQKELVAAVEARVAPEAAMGEAALQRSRHNNYFTLPVLFIMISSHYPATYGHAQNWAVLMLLSTAAIAIRHYFNIRHLPGPRLWPLIPALLLLAAAAYLTVPGAAPGGTPGDVPAASTETAFGIVAKRCAPCHAAAPGLAGLTSAPLGIQLDSRERLLAHAERVYLAAAINQTMPPGNATQMSEPERRIIASWFEGLQDTGESEPGVKRNVTE